MTTTDEDLAEQIARALYSRGNPDLADAWDNPGNLAQAPHWRDNWRKDAAAVLPIIRKAQADAWEKGRLAGASEMHPYYADNPYSTQESR